MPLTSFPTCQKRTLFLFWRKSTSWIGEAVEAEVQKTHHIPLSVSEHLLTLYLYKKVGRMQRINLLQHSPVVRRFHKWCCWYVCIGIPIRNLGNSDFQIHFHTSAKWVGHGKGPAGMIPLIHLCVHWTCGQNIWKRSNVCSLAQNPSIHGMWRTMLKYVDQDWKDYFFGFPKPKNYLIYSYGLIQCAGNGQNVCIPWVKPKDCCEETPCGDSIHIHLYIYLQNPEELDHFLFHVSWL